MLPKILLLIAAPAILVVGLTQLCAVQWWQSYYDHLGAAGRRGVRLNGMISLAIGAPIVIFHNIWSGPPLLLTALGWLLLTESALCFLTPDSGLSGLAEMDREVRGRIIKGTGVVMIIVGGVLAVHIASMPG